VKLEACVEGITADSREVPGRNACDRRHTYCIIIIIILTPWSRVLPEKLTSFQLVEKFPAFYGT